MAGTLPASPTHPPSVPCARPEEAAAQVRVPGRSSFDGCHERWEWRDEMKGRQVLSILTLFSPPPRPAAAAAYQKKEPYESRRAAGGPRRVHPFFGRG